MKKSNKQISITITDITDFDKVLISLENLFKTLITYYIETNNMEALTALVLGVSIYFGSILRTLGIDEKYLGGK